MDSRRFFADGRPASAFEISSRLQSKNCFGSARHNWRYRALAGRRPLPAGRRMRRQSLALGAKIDKNQGLPVNALGFVPPKVRRRY
jgi:hypothetical protein